MSSPNVSLNIEVIDIDSYEGSIPAGKDLVVFEKGNPDGALVLYGFDEVGLYSAFGIKNPVFGFSSFEV